jgi:hypothetical protein
LVSVFCAFKWVNLYRYTSGFVPLHKIVPLWSAASELGVAAADVAAAMDTAAARDDACRARLAAAAANPGAPPRAELAAACTQGLALGLIDEVADARAAAADLELSARGGAVQVQCSLPIARNRLVSTTEPSS